MPPCTRHATATSCLSECQARPSTSRARRAGAQTYGSAHGPVDLDFHHFALDHLGLFANAHANRLAKDLRERCQRVRPPAAAVTAYVLPPASAAGRPSTRPGHYVCVCV